MSSRQASVHLRSDDSERILTMLKKTFDKKKAPKEKDLLALKFIEALAQKNISEITDADEKQEKEALLADVMQQAVQDMNGGEPALIVVRKHFVSIYWYDNIRSENLSSETAEYAAMCKVPALGVADFDDNNFQFYAICDAGTSNMQRCFGEYMFDYEDITPAEASTVCEIINAPFLLEGLTKTLACSDGAEMVSAFEKESGLPVFMAEEECAEKGMKELYKWKGARVYSAEP